METLFLATVFISIVVILLTPYLKSGITIGAASLLGYYYFAEVDGWTAILLLVVGLSLIVLEVFVPDFGLLGILGFLALVLGLYYTTGDLVKTLTDLIIAIALSSIFIIFLFKKGYSFTNWDRFVLTTQIKSEENIERMEVNRELSVGMTGQAVTPLRPSGKAQFGNDQWTYDVLSDDGLIAPGKEIVIQEIIGNKIVVRKI